MVEIESFVTYSEFYQFTDNEGRPYPLSIATYLLSRGERVALAGGTHMDLQDPQPINTAPMDGKVILTEWGFAKYLTRSKKWVECQPGGNAYECANEGVWPCEPKLWTKVPDWVKANFE
jgi:hypothetical protein